MKLKETKWGFALIIKEKVSPTVEISEKMKPLLELFKEVMHDMFSEGLPPMRVIQHHGASIFHDFENPFM